MSQQARKVFDIEEQKAEDVLAAIKVVQPVLSIIREWGGKTQEYTKLTEDNSRLSNEIASIKHVVGLTCTLSTLAEELCEILDNKTLVYKESIKKEEELKNICSDMEKEVLLYQEYAKLFSWIDRSTIEKLLNLSHFSEKEEYLSMMFLLLNAGISHHNLEPLKWSKFTDRSYYIRLNGGWNWMLEKLMANEL